MSDTFLRQVENLEGQHQLDQTALGMAVTHLKALQRDAKTSFLDTVEFNAVVEKLDDLFTGSPPLRFLEDLLSFFKAQEHELEANVLPDLLQRAGLRSVVTQDGDTVRIKEFVAASLQDEVAFTAWAEANGYADILKVKFTVRKGENLAAVRTKLAELNTNYTEGLDKSGLPQALGKLARERLEADLPLPPETALAVRVFEEARLT